MLLRVAVAFALFSPVLALAQERSARLLPSAEVEEEDRPTPPLTRWDYAALGADAAFDAVTDALAVAWVVPSARCVSCTSTTSFLYAALLWAGLRPFLDALVVYGVGLFNEDYAPSYFGGMRGAFAGVGIAATILIAVAILGPSTPVVISALVIAGVAQPAMTAWFASRNKVPRRPAASEPPPPAPEPSPGVPILSL